MPYAFKLIRISDLKQWNSLAPDQHDALSVLSKEVKMEIPDIELRFTDDPADFYMERGLKDDWWKALETYSVTSSKI